MDYTDIRRQMFKFLNRLTASMLEVRGVGSGQGCPYISTVQVDNSRNLYVIIGGLSMGQ